jgi:hypothetical protein
MAVGGIPPLQNNDYDPYNGSFAMTAQQVHFKRVFKPLINLECFTYLPRN